MFFFVIFLRLNFCNEALVYTDKVSGRNSVYDSSMGACLHVLHSTCPNDVVESTASDIVNVFPKSLQSTESPELQVRTYLSL